MGRPSIRTKEITDEICRRLARGQTLRAMCREVAHLPHRDTVNDWLIHDVAFSDRVARAREVGSHALIEENRDIADDGSNDWMEKMGRDGQPIGWMLNGEHVQRSKLRIDQRWREAEALLPKVYGKRQTIEHAGGIAITTGDNSDEIMAEIMELLASGRVKLPPGVQLEEGDAEEPEELAEDDFSDIARRTSLPDWDDDDDDIA